MKDKGLSSGLVQNIETSKKEFKGFFGFRKMFWDYLNKLGVPFYDPCCTDAATSASAVRVESGTLEYNNAGTWTAVPASDLALPTNATFGVVTATDRVVTNAIQEQTAGSGITMMDSIIISRTAVAHDTTGTATAADIRKGLITSTSGAAVGLTLDTVANIVSLTGASRGTTFDLIVDNGVGANTVTVIVGTGMTASSAITGGTTLTVASGVVGRFGIYIQSGTTAKLYRIA